MSMTKATIKSAKRAKPTTEIEKLRTFLLEAGDLLDDLDAFDMRLPESYFGKLAKLNMLASECRVLREQSTPVELGAQGGPGKQLSLKLDAIQLQRAAVSDEARACLERGLQDGRDGKYSLLGLDALSSDVDSEDDNT